ncbi:hypothetical protein GCM10027056_24880 [Glaciibacter psychrotolerans]
MLVAVTSLALVFGSAAAPAFAASDEPTAPTSATTATTPRDDDASTAPVEETQAGVAAAGTALSTISGSVVDPQGKPAGDGIYIKLMIQDAASGNWSWLPDLVTAPRNGSYTLNNVPAGAYRLGLQDFLGLPVPAATVFWPNSATVDEASDIEVLAGTALTGMDFVLTLGATVAGQVDARNAAGALRPLPSGVQVVATVYEKNRGVWNKRADRLSARVNGTAGYTLTGLPAGTYRIGFSDSADGTGLYREQFWPGKSSVTDATSFTVVAGEKKTAFNATMILKSKTVPAPTVKRISGADRYSTSVELSQSRFSPDNLRGITVYIATGVNYPDALAAAPAATREYGPLLLTLPTSLPAVVKAEIKRLKPAKIVVVGGKAAVSESVFSDLKSLSGNVIRVSGADRFETGRKVVTQAFGTEVTSAYIATGLNYPDALSASAAAGSSRVPVILVNGNAQSVDSATKALIVKLKAKNLTLVGGTSAISAGLATSLKSIAAVDRLSGSDRFETSRQVNKAAIQTRSDVYFATGFQFADALAGAAIAGSHGAPLYVVPSGCVPASIKADLNTYAATSVTLIGGKSALGAGVETLSACK